MLVGFGYDKVSPRGNEPSSHYITPISKEVENWFAGHNRLGTWAQSKKFTPMLHEYKPCKILHQITIIDYK
jgi:hypothetical protein